MGTLPKKKKKGLHRHSDETFVRAVVLLFDAEVDGGSVERLMSQAQQHVMDATADATQVAVMNARLSA